MDTRKLVLGQKVRMSSSGIYDCGEGRVVEIMPEGVVVHTSAGLLRFDKDGKELDGSRRQRLGFAPSADDKFHSFLWYCAPEFQPWELDDLRE
jgi:hypothetical protein